MARWSTRRSPPQRRSSPPKLVPAAKGDGMADPASLAQRAGELAGDAGALARRLDELSQQLALSTQQAAHGSTPFVFELTVFVLDRKRTRLNSSHLGIS